MMQNKLIKRIRRFLLWVGISLCCVAILEAGQEVVKAVDLHVPEAPPPIAQSAPTSPDQKTPSHKVINPSSSNSQSSPEANQQEANQQPVRQQKLAINTGSANEAPQKIAQVTSTQIAANTWKGASFPVEGFQAYTSPFGYRPSPYGGYSQEFHYGLDMAAPEGSYIRNWWGGKVVEVSDDSNCGTSVVVESGPWMHIYCHMQGHVEEEDGKRYMIDRDGGVQIWEDQQIQAGSRIGRVGMTGRTTGPHLHWGLKYDANWVDPALVLRAMYFNQQQTAQLSQDQMQ